MERYWRQLVYEGLITDSKPVKANVFLVVCVRNYTWRLINLSQPLNVLITGLTMIPSCSIQKVLSKIILKKEKFERKIVK